MCNLISAVKCEYSTVYIVSSLLQTERDYLMKVVCEATQSSDKQVRVVALQNLVKIMSLYYQYMSNYMGTALFAVSIFNLP